MESKHYQRVMDSLSGDRAIDEQTLSSIEILRDRLEQLKKADSIFAEVEFSSFVEQMAKSQQKLAVN